MTEETAPTGAGAIAAPAETPTPKSDAEAAQQEAQASEVDEAANAAKDAEAKQAEEKRQKQGNRTREYINRINGENAELRRRIAEMQQSAPPAQRPAQNGPPELADYDFDFSAWTKANTEYQRQQWREEQQQQAAARGQQEALARYDQRIAAFAERHPDFQEAVGSIDPSFLTPDLQAAIITHELGPEIAYHLANNEDDLWSLASIRAELLPAAVSRLAARLGAAPPVQQAAPVAAIPQRPISQAPAPVPTVGGRSPTETPPEKLTDDEWYRRDAEKRRKR